MRKTLISLLLAILFIPAYLILTTFALGMVSVPLKSLGLQDEGLFSQALTPLVALVSAVILAIPFLGIQKIRLGDLGLSPRGRIREMGQGALLAASLFLAGFLLLLAMGSVRLSGAGFHPITLVLQFAMFIIVALHEEFVFRGVVLRSFLGTRMHPHCALLVSSVLFALLHLMNPGLTILSMVNLILAGVLLGAAYLLTRNLWMAISIHLFWNFIQGPVLGFMVSGNGFGDSIIQITEQGSEILNGGAFGFEGSLTCAILTVPLIVLLLRKESRERKTACLKMKDRLMEEKVPAGEMDPDEK